MKRSIHGAKLRFRNGEWEFLLASHGIVIEQTWRGDLRDVQRITICKHHVPAFVSFLRWGLLEMQGKQPKPTRRREMLP